MHDAIRARIRSILQTITRATRALPTLGFGRPPEPPVEPVHRLCQISGRGLRRRNGLPSSPALHRREL